MALSAATVWEVRTTGVDTNGGGFVTGASGTDYSQQNAAQYSGTDLVVDATTNTKVTSASHSFVAADVGNIMQITAGTGWTVGFYQIASVASGAATLDRSPAAVSTTGGSYAVGGAIASPAIAFAQSVAGNTLFLKYNASPFLITSASPNVSGGTIVYTGSQTLVGYDTNRTIANTDANRPTIKSNVNSVSIFSGSSGFSRTNRFRNFIVDGNQPTQSSVTGINAGNGGDQSEADTIKVINCTTGITALALCVNCYASSCVTGFSSCATCYGCVATSCTTAGFAGSGPQFCIAAGCGKGFTTNLFLGSWFNCTAVNNTSHGFEGSPNPTMPAIAADCISYGNGGYGFSVGTGMLLIKCAVGSNTSGNVTGGPFELGTVTLTANPFTNPASGDFSLNNTAGAGAACRAAGFPGVFPNGTTTGYLDIGAVQHQDSGGGSGSIMIHPGMSGRIAG